MKAKHFNFNPDKWDHISDSEAQKEYAIIFQKNLVHGEFFTYSDAYTPKEIQSIFRSIGHDATYCPPKSFGYKNFGSQTMTFSEEAPVFRNEMEKQMALGARKREVAKVNAKKAVKECLYEKDLVEEITILGDLAIIKCKSPRNDDFYTEDFYFQSANFNAEARSRKGRWERHTTVSFDFDKQLLIALGYKHDGLNSQFANYACKMLEIE